MRHQRSKPERYLRHIVGQFLGRPPPKPHPVHRSKRLDLPYAERFPARKDVAFFELGDGLCLAVFWKGLVIGTGPAFSVHAGAVEALKFDCFGEGEGHFHTAIPRTADERATRAWLVEKTRRGQVDRALFEIEMNLAYYLTRIPALAPDCPRADPDLLASAVTQARILAYRFADDIEQMRTAPVQLETAN